MIQSTFFENKGFSQTEKNDIITFDSYLTHIENKQIVIFTSKNTANSKQQGTEIHIPYTTRWSPAYKRKIVAKMFSVEEYITKKSKSPVITLLTLTGYQNGKTSIAHTGSPTTRAQLFTELKNGCHLLLDNIRTLHKEIPYLWVIEPHKSGFPHIHIALFGYIPKQTQQRLTNLWAKKYDIGSAEHGINFNITSVNESIKSIKNYLLKYISKSISSNGRKSWSPEEFLYHATAWKNHHRYIGMSQSISRYCTAKILRYRYTKITQIKTTTQLTTNKDELIHQIKYYKKIVGIDPPKLTKNEDNWHYSIIINKGTPSIFHEKKTNNQSIITWINKQITQLVGYTDNFIQMPQ